MFLGRPLCWRYPVIWGHVPVRGLVCVSLRPLQKQLWHEKASAHRRQRRQRRWDQHWCRRKKDTRLCRCRHLPSCTLWSPSSRAGDNVLRNAHADRQAEVPHSDASGIWLTKCLTAIIIFGRRSQVLLPPNRSKRKYFFLWS